MPHDIDEALSLFQRAEDYEAYNRDLMAEDYRFGRLGEQWPEEIARARRLERRGMLTLNHIPKFVRHVVNESRANRPSIQVRPVDDNADKITARILQGMIRNIEVSSLADIAYDTAIDMACSMGVGYVRIRNDYACADSFDKSLVVERVHNPLAVYRDAGSTSADSSDWDYAFIIDNLSKSAFDDKYPDADGSEFSAGDDGRLGTWFSADTVRLAEYWRRTKVQDLLLRLSNGAVMLEGGYLRRKDEYDAMSIGVVEQRETMVHKVVQRIMSGREFLEENEWAGMYIPISACYGEEVLVDGRRTFLSLFHFGKDPQRQHNYWQTSAVEKVALETRAPWLGPVGAFETDRERWERANAQNYSYLQYDGQIAPTRNFYSGVPAGDAALAAMAVDEMKGILGIYDASLGAQSNETSGRAIGARVRQGSISTFHFHDNLARCIRHVGAILLDKITNEWTGPMVARVLSEDGAADTVKINQEVVVDGETTIFDITTGRYDAEVRSGPSFGTRREESSQQMTELVRTFPQAAPLLADLIAKSMDWPYSEEVERRFRTLLPQGLDDDVDPAMQKEIEERDRIIAEGKRVLEEMAVKIKAMEKDKEIEQRKADVEAFKAETDRMEAVHEISLDGEHVAMAEKLDRLGQSLAAIETRLAALSSAVFSRKGAGKVVRMPDGSFVAEKVTTVLDADGREVSEVQRARAVKGPDGWDVITETEPVN